MKTLDAKAVYMQVVRARVAQSNHTQWGGDDSLAVVEALTKALCDAQEEERREQGKAFSFWTDIEIWCGKVINPSAFAQTLELLPDGSGFDAEGKVETLTFDAELNMTRAMTPGEISHANPAYIRRAKRGTKRGAGNGL